MIMVPLVSSLSILVSACKIWWENGGVSKWVPFFFFFWLLISLQSRALTLLVILIAWTFAWEIKFFTKTLNYVGACISGFFFICFCKAAVYLCSICLACFLNSVVGLLHKWMKDVTFTRWWLTFLWLFSGRPWNYGPSWALGATRMGKHGSQGWYDAMLKFLGSFVMLAARPWSLRHQTIFISYWFTLVQLQEKSSI